MPTPERTQCWQKWGCCHDACWSSFEHLLFLPIFKQGRKVGDCERVRKENASPCFSCWQLKSSFQLYSVAFIYVTCRAVHTYLAVNLIDMHQIYFWVNVHRIVLWDGRKQCETATNKDCKWHIRRRATLFLSPWGARLFLERWASQDGTHVGLLQPAILSG